MDVHVLQVHVHVQICVELHVHACSYSCSCSYSYSSVDIHIHINIDIAILFGFLNAQFSDGAKLAVKRGMEQIIQPDWKKVFEPENIMKEVRAITEGIAVR